MTYLAVQVGAAGGSAHGGASPPAYSAGSGCPPGPKARVSPGRLLSDLMLRLLASLSPFVALRFLPLPCVRFSPLRSSSLSRGVSPPFAFSASFPFLPFPSPSLRPVLSSSLQFSPRSDTGSSTDLSALVPSCFPPLPSPSFPFLASSSFQFGYVFLSFPSASSCFLPLPSLSFRPVLSGSLHSRPLRSPAVFPPTRRSDYLPLSFRIPGSAAPFSGLGYCGPRVAPKRPHTTPQERQK